MDGGQRGVTAPTDSDFRQTEEIFLGEKAMEPFSSCSNLIENARLEEPSFWNLVSSIFNLMNAVIGAGIIGRFFEP